jgi:hypothetical protein
MSEIDIKFVQNNDVQITFTITRQDGTAVNLTGATVKFSLVNKTSGEAEFSKSTATSGVSISSPATAGIVVVTIDKEDTDADGFEGEYYYELVITDASGDVSTVTDSNNEVGIARIRKQYAAP